MTMGAFSLHGGMWSPLDLKANNSGSSWDVGGQIMQPDEFGNYLAGYYAGYSGTPGIYTGMRVGGHAYAAVGAVVSGVASFFEQNLPAEHWSDRDSIPMINAGFEAGSQYRLNPIGQYPAQPQGMLMLIR